MADLTQFFYHVSYEPNYHFLFLGFRRVGKMNTLIFKPLHMKVEIVTLNLPPVRGYLPNLNIESKIVEIIMPNEDKSGTCTVVFNETRVANVPYEVNDKKLNININSHGIYGSLGLIEENWTSVQFTVINKKNGEDSLYNVVIGDPGA